MTNGADSGSVNPELAPPIISVSSSLTILMNCCPGVRLPCTSSPTALDLTERKKALTTLKLTSASKRAILTSFRVLLTFSSVKRPRPRTLRNEPLNLPDRVSNIGLLKSD